MTRGLAFLAVCLVVTSACSEKPMCVPNASVGCACPGGLSGTQVCQSDGVYSACDCSSGEVGDAGTGSEHDAGGVGDTGTGAGRDAGEVGDTGTGSERDAGEVADVGTPPDAALAPFEIFTLDPAAGGALPLSLAISGDTLGVSYFVESQAADGGVQAELRYVEKGGQPQVVDRVTNVYGGGTLAYDSKGAPSVAYLGPPSNGGNRWYDAKTVVSTRSGGVWTPSVAVSIPDEVVGLYSTIAIDSTDTVHVAYRDVHYGQFPVQDWQHSRLGYVTGKPGGWVDGTAVDGGNRIEGHGGLMSLLLADDQPTLVYSTMPGGAMDTPRDVMFIRREAAGWPDNPTRVRTCDDVHEGASLSYAKGQGYAIAWRDSSQLRLTESVDGVDWTRADDPVVGSGSGGWYPSAAFTSEGYPAVAYYVCATRTGVTEPCPESENALVLAWRVSDVWQRVTVDPSGGHFLKLAYWKGRAVIAYRDPQHTSLRLAVQR